MAFEDIYGKLIDICSVCGRLAEIEDKEGWACATCDTREPESDSEEGYERECGVGANSVQQG